MTFQSNQTCVTDSVASSLAQSTCPTNILPATLKVSVGEVPIVICMHHAICVNKNTWLLVIVWHGRRKQYTLRPTGTYDAVRGRFKLSLPSEWATALSPKSKGLTSRCWRTQQWAKPEGEISKLKFNTFNNQRNTKMSTTYLKGKNVADQVTKNKTWAFFGIGKEYL